MALQSLNLDEAKEKLNKIIDINDDRTSKYSKKLADLRELIEGLAKELDPNAESKDLANSTDFIFSNWHTTNVDLRKSIKNETDSLRKFLNYFHHYKNYDYDRYESLDDKKKDFSICVRLLSSSIIFFTNNQISEKPVLTSIYANVDKINNGQVYLFNRNELLKKVSAIGDMFNKNLRDLESKIDQLVKNPNTIDGKLIDEIKGAFNLKEENTTLSYQKQVIQDNLKNTEFDLNKTKTELNRWEGDYKNLDIIKNTLVSEKSLLVKELESKKTEIINLKDDKNNLSNQLNDKEQAIKLLERDINTVKASNTQLLSGKTTLENQLKAINESYKVLQPAIKQWKGIAVVGFVLALLIGGSSSWLLKPKPEPRIVCENKAIQSEVSTLFAQIAKGDAKAKENLISRCESANTKVTHRITANTSMSEGDIQDFVNKIDATMEVLVVVTDSVNCKVKEIFVKY